jgi:hypothetical protein
MWLLLLLGGNHWELPVSLSLTHLMHPGRHRVSAYASGSADRQGGTQQVDAALDSEASDVG